MILLCRNKLSKLTVRNILQELVDLEMSWYIVFASDCAGVVAFIPLDTALGLLTPHQVGVAPLLLFRTARHVECLRMQKINNSKLEILLSRFAPSNIVKIKM